MEKFLKSEGVLRTAYPIGQFLKSPDNGRRPPHFFNSSGYLLTSQRTLLEHKLGSSVLANPFCLDAQVDSLSFKGERTFFGSREGRKTGLPLLFLRVNCLKMELEKCRYTFNPLYLELSLLTFLLGSQASPHIFM